MTINHTAIRRTAALAAAGAAALVLAACGSNGDSGHGSHAPAPASSSASPGRHNAADTAFAKGMIPHHRQAVDMAELAPGRAQSPKVKKLAEDIKAAQDPEIRTLSGWLTSWGQDVPAEDSTAHSTHDMDDMGDMEGTGGMMTAGDMATLEHAKGRAFDRAFLRMMVEHHEGAVDMARTEQSGGTYAPARKMAGQIIASQSVEIKQMNQLLGRS